MSEILFPDDVAEWLHWAIFGGESDQPTGRARECYVEWIERGVGRLGALGVNRWTKQLGSNSVYADERGLRGIPVPYGRGKRDDIDAFPSSLRIREFPR